MRWDGEVGAHAVRVRIGHAALFFVNLMAESWCLRLSMMEGMIPKQLVALYPQSILLLHRFQHDFEFLPPDPYLINSSYTV